jgi:hypothetical protein
MRLGNEQDAGIAPNPMGGIVPLGNAEQWPVERATDLELNGTAVCVLQVKFRDERLVAAVVLGKAILVLGTGFCHANGIAPDAYRDHAGA